MERHANKPKNTKDHRQPGKARREEQDTLPWSPPEGTNLTSTLISDFQPPEQPENKWLIFETLGVWLFFVTVLGHKCTPFHGCIAGQPENHWPVVKTLRDQSVSAVKGEGFDLELDKRSYHIRTKAPQRMSECP